MIEFVKNPNFDFLGKARYFGIFSLLLIAAGIVSISRPDGLRYGVEFSGGTQLVAQFERTPQIDKIRDAVAAVSPGAVIQTYDQPGKNQVLIRLAGESAEEGAELTVAAERTLKALSEQYRDNPVLESSSEIVGPVVGAELRRKAIQLTVLGLLFQLIYIGVRFGGGVWGSAAALAALHDVLVTLGLLSFAGYEITLNVIAALLTLVGYSVNDTIVIFDRIRENLRQRRKDPFPKLVNESINQTLTRTLISSGTTFLAVLGLYVFGGEVLNGFAFTMVVGIVVGTYSTIYIATPLVVWWKQRDARAVSAKAAL